VNGQNVVVTEVTADMVNPYYDVAYAGYAKVGTASIKKNCHGHAFDVPAAVMPDIYGVATLLSAGQCWQGCSTEDAKLAYNEAHSIKVTGDMCTVDIGSGQQTPIEAYVTSSEKQGPSRVYTQSNACPNGVNINKSALNQGKSFSPYKYDPSP